MDKYKVLICDDQEVIHETVTTYLENEGYQVYQAYDGEEALNLFNNEKPNFIILDLMMPKKNGIDVCKEIRQVSSVPIIMLTAKGEEIDRILGLELGADDYIVKPFSIRELVARIKAIKRRIESSSKEDKNDKIIIEKLEIDINSYDVKYDGVSLCFTPKEVETLNLLASHPGMVYDREQILSTIWGYEYFGDTRTIDTTIKRIRSKFPKKNINFSIKSIYGVGYKFEVEDNDKR